MTGTLTLKRRFLEENAGSANFGSQKLQFFEKHYELLKISIGYFLISINYHHQRQIYLLY